MICVGLLQGLIANAQGKQTTITIRVHENTGSSVSLYSVENGEAKRLGFRWPKSENGDTCMFTLYPEKESIYYISKTGGKAVSLNHVLYLKPGVDVAVDAYSSRTAMDFDSCAIQQANAETRLLAQWTTIFNDYCELGTKRQERDSFINAYGQFVQKAEALKKKATLPNKKFNSIFKQKLEADILYPKAAAYFNFTHRMNSTMDTSVNHQSFYRSLKGKQFCNARILQSEHGLDLLKYTVAYNSILTTGSQEKMLATPMVTTAKALCNDTVRGALLSQYMMGVTNYEQFMKEIVPFKKSIVAANMGDAYQYKMDEITLFAKGLPGYNFKLPDTKDKVYSLADFKGKIVVVDIWAMWCAPCLAEKPYYQKIEEEYKGNNQIVFLSVSVDGNAKKEPWKGFVAKKGWHGIELLAEHDKSIMKYYKIAGIPRFMIFDAEGKIVTVDAPRPSDPGFKALIEQTLKGNE